MGIFSGNHTCPMPTTFPKDAPEPITGNLYFYHLNVLVSGICTAFSFVVIVILMTMHATHLSKPSEQIKIMKICWLVPLYSGISFVSIVSPNSDIYLSPWLDLFQSIALGSFFLLMCEFISPSEDQRDLFFAALRVPQKGKPTANGLEWFRKSWIAIFQYPVVCLLVAVLTDITQAAGIYCMDSEDLYFSHIWLEIVSNVSVTIAVSAVIKFYTTLRKDLVGHQPLAKLLAFKLIVGLGFLEGIIFIILRLAHALQPSSKLTYADVMFGIQNMVVCIQMAPLSTFFYYAYPVGPYLLSKRKFTPGKVEGADYYPVEASEYYQGGFLGFRAWLVFLSPMEILQAIKFAFTMAREARKKTVYDDQGVSLEPTRGTAYGGYQQLQE